MSASTVNEGRAVCPVWVRVHCSLAKFCEQQQAANAKKSKKRTVLRRSRRIQDPDRTGGQDPAAPGDRGDQVDDTQLPDILHAVGTGSCGM